MKQANLEAERRDGLRRHFSFDWQEVAKHSPDYLEYVEAERQRLGEDHPIFRTQYRLLTVSGGGRLFTHAQLAQLQGSHPRLLRPIPGETYVAGIDLAGQAEAASSSALRQDSTVVTIARIRASASDFSPSASTNHLEVIQHYRWTGVPHADLYPQLHDLLRNVWQCRRVVVDATGVGEGVASFLERSLGGVVVTRFKFTDQSKSRLGFELLSAVNSGRLKVYAPDGSEEFRESRRQMELARTAYRANQTIDFSVDPSAGHDDFLMSLALVVSASDYAPRVARGRAREV